jgi:tRNA A37 threonylcarbamoyladenosine synthetase subunit TsaC/SUA5/YrdC
LAGGMPSTVIECVRDGWKLIREGAISADKIKATL